MSNPDQRPASEAEPARSATHNVGDRWLGRTLRTLFGSKAGSIRADLRSALEKGAGEAGFSPKESAMLRNILSLRERRVADVMVPRADIIAVQKSIALGDLLKVFATQAHSRLVVYDDALDDAIGMVHIRDLIALMTARAADAAAQAGEQQPLPTGLDLKAIDLSMSLSTAKLVREILFAPPSMPVLDLLAKMQATRIHLALVIDEYGGTDGLVSIEDIVEQIVGDIEDEHDEAEVVAVVRQLDGSYLADARASLEDVTKTVGAEFDAGDEVVPGPGRFEIEVLDADPRRVKRLKIYQSPDRPGAARSRPAGSSAGPTAASPEPSTPEAPTSTSDPPKASAQS